MKAIDYYRERNSKFVFNVIFQLSFRSFLVDLGLEFVQQNKKTKWPYIIIFKQIILGVDKSFQVESYQ